MFGFFESFTVERASLMYGGHLFVLQVRDITVD